MFNHSNVRTFMPYQELITRSSDVGYWQRLKQRNMQYCNDVFPAPTLLKSLISLHNMRIFVVVFIVGSALWTTSILVSCLLMSGAIYGTWRGLRKITESDSAKPTLRQVAREGEPVLTLIVQANSNLYSPGDNDHPCLVVFAFGQHENLEFLTDAAGLLAELKDTKQTDPMLAAAAEFVTDERWVRHRRRQMPAPLTNGRVVYVADLQVRRAMLPNGFLETPVIPCMAIPGSSGIIEMIPWKLLSDA